MSLLKLEPGILKSKVQKNKTVVASWELKPKGAKPKVLVNQMQSNLQHKVQEVKSKTSNTNLNGYLNLKLSILHIFLGAKEKQKSWYLDRGCSRHMT